MSCLLFAACFSGKDDMVELENATGGEVPRWFTETPKDTANYYGKASQTSGVMEIARKKAYASAKQNLVEAIKSTVKSRIRTAIKTSGSLEMDDEEISTTFDSAVQLLANQTVSDVEINEEATLPFKSGYRSFISLKVKKSLVADDAARALKKTVKKTVTDPQKKNALNSMFDDNFFNEAK